MPTLTFHDVTLGELEDATVEVDYGGLAVEGMGQASLLVKFRGELDEVTLDLGEMRDGGESALRIAAHLRTLADEVQAVGESYEDIPTQFDGFAQSGRDGWEVYLEGSTVEVPRGLTEEGAIVALELACRESGVFPSLWRDRYAGTSSSMPVALTAEDIRNAAAAVLDGGGFEEFASTCEHCGEALNYAVGAWRHDAPYGRPEIERYLGCRESGSGHEEDTDLQGKHATPVLPFERADVEAILDGPEALGV